MCLSAGQMLWCNGNTPGRSAQSWNSFVCLFEYIKIFSIQLSWLFCMLCEQSSWYLSNRETCRQKCSVFKNVNFVFWNKCYYEGMVPWLILEQHVLGMKAIGWKQTDLHVQPCDCWSQDARNGCLFSFQFISFHFRLTSCITSVLMSFSFLFCHCSFFLLSFQPFLSTSCVSLRYLVCTFLV